MYTLQTRQSVIQWLPEIPLVAPIDITGKDFKLSCFPIPLPGICGLYGNNTVQLLTGAPSDVHIFGLFLARGRAGNNTSGNGGAIKITGGTLTLTESQFFNNRADVRLTQLRNTKVVLRSEIDDLPSGCTHAFSSRAIF
jgi:hypothetical protein